MSGNPQTRSGAERLGRLRQFIRDALPRLLHNGPQKFGALLVATLFWIFANSNSTLVSQRTLRAPLHTEGLSADQRVSGLPERVELRLSGPSNRIQGLNPEGIDVLLNLRGVTGEFEQDVRVFPPQGITLVSVNPSEVLGTVEELAEKRVPVRAVLMGEAPADAVIEVAPSPAEVSVRGAASLVARVTHVAVPFDPAGARDRAPAYAVAADGEPVVGVTVNPEQVRLQAERRDVLYTRLLPVELIPPTLPGLEVQSAELTLTEVTVVGPWSALATLESLTATLPRTPELTPGRYTLGVTLDLPEGVSALSAPQLTLQLRAPRQGSAD